MILSVRTSASTCHLALVTVQACSLLLEETFPSFDLWNPPGTQHEYLSCVTLIKLSQCCLKFGKMQHITVSRICQWAVLSLLVGWHRLFSSHGELAEKWGSSLETRKNVSQVKLLLAQSLKQNHLGWKIPLRSSSPTIHLAYWVPLLNFIPWCHIHTSLKYLQEEDSITSLSNLFQCLTIFSVKKFLLIASLNLLWYNLRPFPPILPLITWEKRPIPTLLQAPVR